MKYKIIYIYESDKKKHVYTGEFKIKAFGEDYIMGQSIQAFSDDSNAKQVTETLSQRMFTSLAVMEYAVNNKYKKEKILDAQGQIIEEMGLKILENIPHLKQYEVLFEKCE